MNFISMKCPNCGGALEITAEMERFHCGYCGQEQMVERRGGTVLLKLVDGLAKVQRGTDKTAAELALVRLKQELDTTKQEWEKVDQNLKLRRKSADNVGAVIALLLLIGGMIFSVFVCYILIPTLPSYSIAVCLFISMAFAIAILIYYSIVTSRKQNELRTQAWRPFGEKIKDLEGQIEINKRICES